MLTKQTQVVVNIIYIYICTTDQSVIEAGQVISAEIGRIRVFLYIQVFFYIYIHYKSFGQSVCIYNGYFGAGGQ